MKRAIKHLPLSEAESIQIWATVTLAYDDRHRRRIKMVTDTGEEFLLDLPQAVYLADGDLLALDDGEFVLVRAALEDVMDATCDTIEATARLAWHIGNRHTPVQVLNNGVIRLRADHVLASMIEGLGGQVTRM
ncbi:MAG: urease accessory protein UreE, partial [Alphaproteobacteria bacterium]|nr:urease accessory protein UreE [Alphaproteobacteria bacterium]